MVLEKDLFIKGSGIHGLGVFTSIDIKTEQEIMVIKGEVISETECVRREEDDNNVYIFWNGDNYIDVSNTEKIKYINHSCSSNCEVQDRDDESLWLVASINIKAGEELVIDYGYDEIYENCTCDVCLIGEDEEG